MNRKRLKDANSAYLEKKTVSPFSRHRHCSRDALAQTVMAGGAGHSHGDRLRGTKALGEPRLAAGCPFGIRQPKCNMEPET